MKVGNLIRKGLCVAVVLAGFACSKEGENAQTSPKLAATPPAAGVLTFPVKDVIMSVNGEPVDRALVSSYAVEKGFDLNDPAQLKIASEKVAEFVAIAQAARQDPYSATPEYALAQLKIAASVYVKHLSITPAFTDAQVQANFESQMAEAGGVQLHVQQIMVNQVLAAQTVQAALASGKPFDAVMTELKGTPGVVEAKDLGWITVLSLPKPLRAPTLALAQGGFTPTPVNVAEISYFHNVVESKPLVTPSFAEVKDGMRKAMEETRAELLINKINAQSKVELR